MKTRLGAWEMLYKDGLSDIVVELTAGDEIRGRNVSGEKVDFSSLYPKEFFDFFGSGNDLGFDTEPDDPVEDIHVNQS